jgi:hypothetical protein
LALEIAVWIAFGENVEVATPTRSMQLLINAIESVSS